jgi:hypothetical protein
MADPRFEVDESSFPLVFVRAPEAFSMESLELFFRDYERMLSRNQPFANVTDVTRVRERPPAVARQRLAEWTKSIEPRVVRYSKGDARVVKSGIIRGAMTAVGWLHQHPVKQQWFSSHEEAVTWAIERLEDAGVELPEHVRKRAANR